MVATHRAEPPFPAQCRGGRPAASYRVSTGAEDPAGKAQQKQSIAQTQHCPHIMVPWLTPGLRWWWTWAPSVSHATDRRWLLNTVTLLSGKSRYWAAVLIHVMGQWPSWHAGPSRPVASPCSCPTTTVPALLVTQKSLSVLRGHGQASRLESSSSHQQSLANRKHPK